ncbi:MAG: MotA/TolQ/ExbB proton channel family protein [Bacteroidales bacterium]|nr:MotA/TolQ/ExbB proton channel family protein [Bacteroidales bacterium]
MSLLSDILYWISTGLLVPVILALIFLFIRSLLLVGSFFGQYLKLNKVAAQVRRALTDVQPDNLNDVLTRLPERSSAPVIVCIRQMIAARNNRAELQRLLSEYEIQADRELSTSRMLTKLGPMLGLMGTLIPMGPALAGLASGDIESMARNMQVAFATTVTGLVAAAIGFITQQVKQRWFRQDLTNLEYLADVICGNDACGTNDNK